VNAREQWKLRGPVRTCRIERTFFSRRCGADACEREESHNSTALEFREGGTLSRQEHTNPDGSQWTTHYEYVYESNRVAAVHHISADSVTIWRNTYDSQGRLSSVQVCANGAERTTEQYDYDAEGRKRKTQLIDLADQRANTHYAWGIEGSDTRYSAPGTAKITTVYNAWDRPVEVLFYDAGDRLLSRVALSYDVDGNLIEELQAREPHVFADLFASVPDAERDAVRAVVQSIAEPVGITHRYDQRGRRVETRMRFGLLSEEVKTRTYNEIGDEIAEIIERHSREYGRDDEGKLSPAPGSERESHSEARLHYEYDDYGNWTSKTVENRSATGEEFSVCSVEKRTIAYFPH
jgi:hypothetical protein